MPIWSKGQAVARYAKYAVAAPLIDLALNLLPQLSRRDAPPEIINFAGGGDFTRIGDDHVDMLIGLAGLADGQRVLEIGCGIGRNATALHRRFAESIEYFGMDVVRFGITWCQRHFRSRHSRYGFTHVDVYNAFYNPRGRTVPTQFHFPVGAGSFDLAFATSVFTHMQDKTSSTTFLRRHRH